jgi:mono/diheme cytochrome c family protein
MRKVHLVTVSLFVVFAFMVLVQTGCSNSKEEKVPSKAEMIQQGKYLVDLGGCNDCHSPKVMTEMGPVPDTTRLLSGHPQDQPVKDIDPAMLSSKMWMHSTLDATAWIGPWGVSYTANLTPDPETGLGNWTEDLFIKALRTGKHMGVGRPILPPMPWQGIGQVNDQDLKDIFAYLQSLKPVHNKVPDPIAPDMLASILKKDNKKGEVKAKSLQ